MATVTLDQIKEMPGGSRGRRGTNGNLPAQLRAAKEKALKSGKEAIERYDEIGRKNAGPTATNIRTGKVAGMFGFNADWRVEGDRQVLLFSYTGLWHGRSEERPDDMKQGPFGYSDDYTLHAVKGQS